MHWPVVRARFAYGMLSRGKQASWLNMGVGAGHLRASCGATGPTLADGGLARFHRAIGVRMA